MKFLKLSSLLLLLSILVFVSCKNEKGNQNKKQVKQDQPIQKIVKSNPSYKKTHTASNYVVNISSNNEETSTIKISTEGMENEFKEAVEVEGQVLDSYLTDINKDGFKEVFITLSPTDDSGNINLLGFASNSGKSMSQIYIPESNVLRDVNTDEILIENNSITRKFKTNGVLQNYSYELGLGESSYVLKEVKH